jgi:multicomponent Na+:H+ antiporter subunit A
MSLLHLAVLAPFLVAFFIPFLYQYTRQWHTGWFVLFAPLVLFIYFINQYTPLSASTSIIHTVPWIPSLGIHFTIYLDHLAWLFSLIITGIGTLVVLYSIFYMSKERERLGHFYVYLLLFMGAMLGSVLSDNLLVLYTFWEITSVSSFLLIAYWYHRKRSRYGAQKAMLITMSGGFAMLLGFIMLYTISDTLSIREMVGMAGQIADHALFIPAMVLILLGVFTKSAQFPFHIWLPDAMEAPTPISSYLHSATMVKAGVYLAARLTPLFGGHMEWFWALTVCGIVTMFLGSILAVRQTDLKALLAYSTISQLGMIISMLGVGSVALNPDFRDASVLFSGAIVAALFHLINHSIFKGCLFMVIGILDHETGTRDIRRLGGLLHVMPMSFTLTIIGAFSMAGLPPFSGFLSKEMFFTGMLTASRNMNEWLLLLPAAAWIASIFTFIYCMILVFKTFTGPYYEERFDRKPHEAPIGMLISPAILALLVIVLFFFPNVLSGSLLEPAVQAIIPNGYPAEAFAVHISHWHGWNTEILMTMGIIVLGTLMFVYLARWVGIYDSLPHKLTLNNAYDSGIDAVERVSGRLTSVYMTGSIRHYVSYLFVFLIVLLGVSMLDGAVPLIVLSGNAPIEWYEYMIGLTLVTAAVSTLMSKSRLYSIIALSVVGYMVSLFYVIFRAPDLALTQIVVETISTALFLLCFYFLPKLKKEITQLRFRVTNMLISIGVGLTLTIVGLATQGHSLFEPIGKYYEQAFELAGAKNIVNAILVDFRAFDTMLEIVVLFTAGIGVYTLIKLRQSGRDES